MRFAYSSNSARLDTGLVAHRFYHLQPEAANSKKVVSKR